MKKRPAFTLIELLIVTAVFALAVLVATTVFVRIQSNQRQVLGRQRVVADGRYVLEAMARTAKLGLPDYVFYGSTGASGCISDYGSDKPCLLTEPQSVLAIRDQLNIQTCYHIDAVAHHLFTETATDSSGVCDPGSNTGWSDITPADLKIDDFRVYISPAGDPFRAPLTSCPGSNTQGGFSTATGVCPCQAATVASDCFTGQQCISTTTIGQTCTGPGDACICQNPNTQPTVTIYLKTSSTNTKSGEQASSTLQTTVTSRVYRR